MYTARANNNNITWVRIETGSGSTFLTNLELWFKLQILFIYKLGGMRGEWLKLPDGLKS